WSEIDVSCEACHGPGSAHVAWGEAAKKGRAPRDPLMALVFTFKGASKGEWVRDSGYAVARRATPLPSRIELETCARCHARRSEVWTPDEFGVGIAETHRISSLDDPLYFADGQIRDEVYEYASFKQGWMHQVGVTCSDCHDPHSGLNHDRGNALCARCHAPGIYDTKRHHFHPGTDEPGTRCVDCHMPARDYMVVDRRHEHTFRNPRPDLTVATGVPNTCNAAGCHQDRSARWADGWIVKWYGPKRHPRQDFAHALDAGRRWALGADSLLLRVAGDEGQPGIVRASAMALLDRYPSPGALELVRRAARDPDPQVRRAPCASTRSRSPPRRPARRC
ncbi:MAG: hypothetical protein MUF60_11300, partial [Vicinamibacterales bacterium]|nr:hypothetical protein [Vicinamibacterales bacterium]